MRVFVALEIEETVRARIAAFLEQVRELAPQARWVRPESLHITLRFLGEQDSQSVAATARALAGVRCRSLSLAIRGYGFFPHPGSARVFWLGIEAGDELARLAGEVQRALAAPPGAGDVEAFTPHLTLARAGKGSGEPRRWGDDRPNRRFERLQTRLQEMPPPDFGSMTSREFFLFESQLMRGGSRYTKIAAFPLT